MSDAGSRPVRVVIADDHALFVDALRMFLDSSPEIEVVAAATDGESAIDLALHRNADVVLMDAMMPVMDGIEATQRLVALRPSTRVIIVTGSDRPELADEARQAGALGLLAKDRIHERVVAAVLEAAGRS
jgi:DNA-binding NarL/FixJ family response regulator